MKEATFDKVIDLILDTGLGTLLGLIFGVAVAGILMPSGPSIQLVENKKQETKTVCTEKDIDWVKAYPKGSWQRLETLPEQGVENLDNYSALKGTNMWATLNTEKANITPPSKMTYKAVTECLEWKKIPKYSKVKIKDTEA